MSTVSRRGDQISKHPIRPEIMARMCRKMAADMRKEAALGMPPIRMRDGGPPVPRVEAAASMDRQAERWEAMCQST